MKKIINTSSAPRPVGPYSQAVESGGFVFLSGQIAIDPKTNEVIEGDTREQTKLILENIRAVLAAAGLTFKNVIKSTIFLTDMSEFGVVNEVYATCFTDQPPARSTVQVAALPKNVSVEIEVIAERG